MSEAILMAEALYAPLVTLMLLLAYRAYDQPDIARFAALGAAIGVATLARAEGLLLGLVLVIPLCIALASRTATERLTYAAAALGVALLVVAPWTIRNAVRFHSFIPVSNNVATLVDGANCDATYRGRLLGLWRETFSELGDGARTRPQAEACFEGFDIGDPRFDEAGTASRHLRAGTGYARHHAGALPRVALVRVLRTWGVYAPAQQVDYETLEGRPRAWQWAGTIMYWAMVPLAIGGAVVLRRRRRLLWPLLATAVTVTIVAAATYGQQRFRIAAEPAIIVLGAVAIVALAGRARTPARAAP
jgi:hypothetical protein